ncbi:hypothetical protein P153DRAFT_370666 [Dothidotthia symphoricarpi CBS 119687]|uniref:RBR-type E3 ubiquitin transferase n=1 Tax=Dothidotthia symphoricarpi CBS 119687 TaxID=1392245 RepID=A0A6A6A0H8_9PLEO|nr:uncharacterized protein P153DRAFT_370666 [Dothidotthia symphoricarpi CBS 119687]KAF2124755.1 hypothetical protein P153DRAFT_370666 [Dothidotthia symphoricarpi CBS 119687]
MARTKDTACTQAVRARNTALPPPTTRVLRSQTTSQPLSPNTSKVTKPRPRRRRQDPWAPKRKRRPNPNPKPRPPPPTHFTCRICIEERPTADFIKYLSPNRGYWTAFDIPAPCIAHLTRHPRLKNDPVCKSCIGHSMSARLDTLGARQVGIGCLEPGCTEPWSWEFVMHYLPGGAVLEKYNLAMMHVWKQDTTPQLMTCIAPSCAQIGLPDALAQGYPHVSCHACRLRQCAVCLVPWHADQTCAEYAAANVDAQMSAPEKETLRLLQEKDGKRCPNCQLVIEKDGGCDSMLCPGCQTFFNWTTAASVVPGSTKAVSATLYPNGPYVRTPQNGPVVCEMDRLEGIVPPPDLVGDVKVYQPKDGFITR